MLNKILQKILPLRNHNIFIFLITLFVGISSGFFYYNEAPFGDATYYFNTANLIKESFSNLIYSPEIGVAESFNAIVQGFVFRFPGDDFFCVYFLQIIIYSFTGLFIFKLAYKFTGRTGGLITLVFYLVNNKHWGFIYNFKPGVWINFFLILVMYYAYMIFQNPKKRKYYYLVGIFSALLLLTDLRYLPHLLFLYFILLFLKADLFKKIKNIGLSSLILILMISPWVIRQSLVFNKFIFISDLNTITIHHAFNTKYYRSLSSYTNLLINLSEDEYQNQFFLICDSLHLTPGELIYARAEAKKTILDNSITKLNVKYGDLIDGKVFTEDEIATIIKREEERPYWIKLLKRAGQLWAPFRFKYTFDPLSTYKKFYPPASLFTNINRIMTLGILLPFLFIGLYLLVKDKNLFGISIAGILIIHTVVHVLTFMQWRYMLPILPLVTIVGVYGFIKLKDLIHVKHRIL